MTPTTNPGRVVLSVQFDPEQMRHIEQLAEVEDRTKGGMVRRLVDEALTAREATISRVARTGSSLPG